MIMSPSDDKSHNVLIMGCLPGYYKVYQKIVTFLYLNTFLIYFIKKFEQLFFSNFINQIVFSKINKLINFDQLIINYD